MERKLKIEIRKTFTNPHHGGEEIESILYNMDNGANAEHDFLKACEESKKSGGMMSATINVIFSGIK